MPQSQRSQPASKLLKSLETPPAKALFAGISPLFRWSFGTHRALAPDAGSQRRRQQSNSHSIQRHPEHRAQNGSTALKRNRGTETMPIRRRISMNPNSRLTCAAILASVTLLAGCKDFLMNYGEGAYACDEALGGTRASCADYNERHASEAEYQRRKQEEEESYRMLAEGNRNERDSWAREVAAANDEDRALIRATYPEVGFLSGTWCREDRYEPLRIEVLSNDEVRVYAHYQSQMVGFSDYSLQNRYRLEATDGNGRVFNITHSSLRRLTGQFRDYEPEQAPYSRIEMDGDSRLQYHGQSYRRCMS